MLILASDREKTKELCAQLCDHGILIYSCPLETARFLCEKKDTGGVIVDCLPDLHRGATICIDLRQAYPNMPIAAIASSDRSAMPSCDLLIGDTNNLSVLLTSIEQFATDLCGISDAPLSTYDLTVDFSTRAVQYLGYPLKLSLAEFRILYCLFYRAPRATGVDDLLALCYHGKARSSSNVVVQIHRINQKATRIDPRPLIIHTADGYRLRDGIV